MEVPEIQSWLFQVEPLVGESLSHFLGRFRRANDLTPTGLGKAAGFGGAIARWEKFRFNPPPSRQHLEALAKVVGVDVDRLAQMLPPAGVGMKLEPIRLCAACYVESPCHKIEWQLKVTQRCTSHNLTLLSECPNCGARFKVPAVWVDGWCHRCFLTFADMVKHQKSIDY
ncbi:TniQ family protein [Tolypothrix sp. FACHB-123]|uniref:helix-turn-helix domain-containing protein n=1 Tax=Tolypothrix sp. FACHB-123 TaxID=2692868 RepID=UPI0016833DD9|nr:helix-turn-helix transcriptional regulator [Tolypothrix sp. FACHB-123]MBD2353761.1 TniQ family protein [Tolypothrix sp. FACHB-123]